MSTMEQHVIDTVPKRCTGCRRCQLICSFRHEGEFNLSNARILIDDKDEGVEKIAFSENCNQCGICVSYCVYGALRFRKEE